MGRIGTSFFSLNRLLKLHWFFCNTSTTCSIWEILFKPLITIFIEAKTKTMALELNTEITMPYFSFWCNELSLKGKATLNLDEKSKEESLKTATDEQLENSLAYSNSILDVLKRNSIADQSMLHWICKTSDCEFSLSYGGTGILLISM